MNLSRLERLENEAIRLVRDTVAGAERAVLVRGAAVTDLALARQMAGGAAAGTPVRFHAGAREVVVTDAPSGERGTRELLAQAWAADLAVVVTAAGRGLTPEARRQIVLLSLLGVPRVILAVNEMDLVSYDASAFARVQSAFRSLARELSLVDDTAIPVSAVMGDNVGSRS